MYHNYTIAYHIILYFIHGTCMLLKLKQKATLYRSKICTLQRYILHILHKRYALNEMDTSFQQLLTASKSLQEYAHGLDGHGICHRLHAHNSLQHIYVRRLHKYCNCEWTVFKVLKRIHVRIHNCRLEACIIRVQHQRTLQWRLRNNAQLGWLTGLRLQQQPCSKTSAAPLLQVSIHSGSAHACCWCAGTQVSFHNTRYLACLPSPPQCHELVYSIYKKW